MDIDDLRDRIWEYLFKTQTPHSIEEIAVLAECDVTAVRVAVNHEWFAVAEDRVSIAYATPSADARRSIGR